MGGRVNPDEKLVGAWLVSQGHVVRHMRNGEDPPDLVLDDNIAVEITTIASYAYRSVRDFIKEICRSLGHAKDGCGYWIEIAYDDEALLQDKDKGKVKAMKHDIRHFAKIALRNHYANPDAVVYGPERQIDFLPRDGRIRLPHGVELSVIGSINDNRDNVKYKVGAAGETVGIRVVSHLIDTIQSAIRKKTANRIVQERAGKYEEWWLVVTDPHCYAQSLNDDEIQTVADTIDYGAPWRRILLTNIAGDRVSRAIDLTGSERRSDGGERDAA